MATRPPSPPVKIDWYIVFDKLDEFSAAVERASGVAFDFNELISLNTNFVEATDSYLIMSVKEELEGDNNNIVFLRAEGAYLYTKRPPKAETFREFEKIFNRPFGRTTVLAYVVLHKVVSSYRTKMDATLPLVRDLEASFDQAKYRDLLGVTDRVSERLEDLHELLVRLQERSYRHIESRYLSFDYNVLLTECQTFQDRARRRANYLRELARDQEFRQSRELNARIEHLNVVVRRLTALTILIAFPTLITSHFGMNFIHMPELDVWWAYPAVIVSEVAAIVGGIFLFRRIGWL